MGRRVFKEAPLRITFLYILFGGLWILFSDRLLEILFPNPDVALKIQTYKGWLFVIVTGFFLYNLLSKESKAYSLLEENLERERDVIKEQTELLDWATDAIIVTDLEDRILFWNKGAEKIYGWKKEEVLGKKVTEVYFKDISLHAKMKEKVLKEGEWMEEVEQKTKEGKDIVMESRWVLVRDKEGKPTKIMVINTDITKRKFLETRLLRAQRLESIGVLAGGIAHDLNNILSPISMGLQMLKTKISDENILSTINMMEEALQRGINLNSQILSFVRSEIGKMGIIQVKYIIREIERLLKETFPKDIEIKVEVSKDLYPVIGDATKIHQVLMNLCVNAKDAMPNGGVLKIFAENVYLDEDFTKWIPNAKPGPYVLITVSDTGVGIPKDIMDKIFDPFFTTKKEGTGLGLSIVYSVVKEHGGFIDVYSEVGKGTAFKIYLPGGGGRYPIYRKRGGNSKRKRRAYTFSR